MVNDQSENIENVSITEDKFALVFGNEATGISDEIRQ
jgi:tRNA G18 (ribose-2'-O)-methylase SpoU